MAGAAETQTCTLCGLPTSVPILDDQGRPYCCPACKEVSLLLAEDQSRSPLEFKVRPEITETEEVTLALGDLWCTSCSWLIEETLKRTPGVAEAQVNFVRREARVVYDPARLDPRRLARRIRRLGYKATLPDETPHDEEQALLTRLLISFVLVMHIMFISFTLYARDLLGLSSPETAWLVDFFRVILFVAALPVVVMLGLPILRTGLVTLLRRQPNMHTLIAIGAFSAFALSTRNLVLGYEHVYFDTASMLLFLVTVGHWLEVRARTAGSKSVERLWRKVPREALWMSPEGEKRVPVEELAPGARVKVQPGEPFPVDGIIAVGEGDVDESLLTGEPIPVVRRPGDRVHAGTVSVDGTFEVITTAVGAETVAGHIGRLLHQALWQRAPVERLADRLAAWMVPLAVVLAAGTFVYWSARSGYEVGLMHALSVLLIACPCALGLATPLTLWVGLQRASEQGILVRNTGVLERLAKIRRVFFDKTGTLTTSSFALRALQTVSEDGETLLARVAAAESPARHPLAEAIVNAARDRGLDILSPREFEARPGRGVVARVNGTLVYVGNERLLEQLGISLPPSLRQTAEALRQAGMCTVFAGWDGQVQGVLGLDEVPRSDVQATMRELKALGCEIEVLTGDDEEAGRRWQEMLNVPVQAGLTPEEKLARIENCSEPAAVVGDGINDGPALAAAEVGITLGQGTDVARAAAEVILLRDSLLAVPWLVRMARAVMRKVRQNLAWAFVYNIIGLGLAVTGHLQPVIAAFAMVASSVIVTTNALRLQRFPPLSGPDAGESPPST